MRKFLVTEKDIESIEFAIQVLRDSIQARSIPNERSLMEYRSALAGLLCIYPKPEPTWESKPTGAA